MDWKFFIGDVIIPLGTFGLGFFTGKTVEKKNINKANVKGNKNTVIQGNKSENKGDC